MSDAPNLKRIDAGNGWSVERRDASTWAVIAPNGVSVNAYNTRRAALTVARSQTTPNPVWAP